MRNECIWVGLKISVNLMCLIFSTSPWKKSTEIQVIVSNLQIEA